jgi:serine/threonine-protein kinase RsbT
MPRSTPGVEAPAEMVLAVASGHDVVTARGAARELAGDLGLSPTEGTMVATAVSELSRNIASYATRGQVRLFVGEHDGRAALVVEAIDDGPGIADVELALEDGYSTGCGLGLGLPGARRLMDALEVCCEPGAGTRVTMWKWLPRSGAHPRASGPPSQRPAGRVSPALERDRRRVPIQT